MVLSTIYANYFLAGQLEGDLRLVSNVGSVGGFSGRLEFYHDSIWGTVCENALYYNSESFDYIDAIVACRQLGYASASLYGSVGDLG